MALAAFDAPLSYRDWLAFPDDGHQYEVVEGIPVMSPAPNVRHQVVSARLTYFLTGAAPAPLIVMASPVDWVLRADRPAEVRQPDIVVVHPDQLDQRAIRGVPLLAVEILSPWSVERDTVTKRRLYARAGCPHYWLVDPAGPSIVAFALTDGAYEPVAQAAGGEALDHTLPFAVWVVPDELVVGAPD